MLSNDFSGSPPYSPKAEYGGLQDENAKFKRLLAALMLCSLKQPMIRSPLDESWGARHWL